MLVGLIVAALPAAGLAALVSAGTSPHQVPVVQSLGKPLMIGPVQVNWTLCLEGNSLSAGQVLCPTATLSPGAGAWDPLNGALYIANGATDNVSVVNTTTNSIVTTVNVGTSPQAVLFDPVNDEVYVANGNSMNVSVIDCTNNHLLATVSVGTYPDGMAYDNSNGNVYVTNTGSDDVTVLNASTDQVVANVTGVTDPIQAAYDQKNGFVYVVDRSAGQAAIINGSTDRVVGTVTLGDNPIDLVVNPSSGNLYATNQLSETVDEISGASNTVVASTRVGTYPWGIAFDPHHNELFVADAGCYMSSCTPTGNVSVINVTANIVTSIIGVGADPTNLAFDSRTAQMYVLNQNSDSVSILSNSTVPGAFSLKIKASPSSGAAPLNVTLTADATGGIGPYDIDWGLNNSSWVGHGASAQYVFNASGNYTVFATAVDASGVNESAVTTVAVSSSVSKPQPLELSVSASPLNGTVPFSVQFQALVTGGVAPVAVGWNFGDNSSGMVGTSVSHLYDSPGIYKVEALATDALSNQTSASLMIHAYPASEKVGPLTLSVTSSQTAGAAPLTVEFTPVVTGGYAPYELTWNFGDGSTPQTVSGTGSVNHTYARAGSFSPLVTVVDAHGNTTTWNAGSSARLTISVSSKSPSSPWALNSYLLLSAVAIAVAVVVLVTLTYRSPKRRRPLDRPFSGGPFPKSPASPASSPDPSLTPPKPPTEFDQLGDML